MTPTVLTAPLSWPTRVISGTPSGTVYVIDVTNAVVVDDPGDWAWLFAQGFRPTDLRQEPLFAQTQAVTVGSTLTETTLIGAGAGSVVVPANTLVSGKSILLTGFGFHTASGNPTIRIRAYLGSTVVLDTGAVTSGTSTNNGWYTRGLITGIGNSQVQAQGFYTESGGGANDFGMVNLSPITLNLVNNLTFNLTAQWGATGNSLTLTNLLLEVE